MPEDANGGPRQSVPVRMSKQGRDVLDEYRGAWSRSEYIRRAVAFAVKNGLKGPKEPEW